MRNFSTIALLLCSLGWVSISGFESQTVEVQSGENVTLLCSNFSSGHTQIFWFRLVNRSQIHCISSIFMPHEPAKLCSRHQNGKFGMSTNISTIFLHIGQVTVSESGLYFCGYYITKNLVVVTATHLEVQDGFHGTTNQATLILGGVTVFLVIVVIFLAVQNKKLHRARVEGEHPQRTEIQMGSDELNYAAVTFRPKTKRNHTSAPNAISSATR